LRSHFPFLENGVELVNFKHSIYSFPPPGYGILPREKISHRTIP
jgi:hypothetical protein